MGLFWKKIGFEDSFDVTKCLQQVETPDLLHMSATFSELSCLSTMAETMIKERKGESINNKLISTIYRRHKHAIDKFFTSLHYQQDFTPIHTCQVHYDIGKRGRIHIY